MKLGSHQYSCYSQKKQESLFQTITKPPFQLFPFPKQSLGLTHGLPNYTVSNMGHATLVAQHALSASGTEFSFLDPVLCCGL